MSQSPWLGTRLSGVASTFRPHVERSWDFIGKALLGVLVAYAITWLQESHHPGAWLHGEHPGSWRSLVVSDGDELGRPGGPPPDGVLRVAGAATWGLMIGHAQTWTRQPVSVASSAVVRQLGDLLAGPQCTPTARAGRRGGHRRP